MKRFYFIILFIVLSIFIFSQTSDDEDPVKNKEIKAKLLIFNLKAINVEKGLADAVTQNLIIDINSFKYGKYQIMERSSLDKIFKDFNLKIDDPVEYETALKISKMIQANFCVFGSISKLGSNYTLNIRMIRVDSGKIISDDTKYFSSEEDIPDVIGSMAKKISLTEFDIIEIDEIEKREKIAVLYFNHDVDNVACDNFINELRTSLPTFKKYISIDQVVISTLYERFNKNIYDQLTDKDILSIGKDANSKYVMYGTIKTVSGGYNVNVKIWDLKTSDLVFDRLYFTRNVETIMAIGKKIAESISKEKEFTKSDEVIDFDTESYNNLMIKFTNIKRGFLIGGYTMFGLGGASLITGGILVGVYYYKLNYMVDLDKKGLGVSKEYYDITTALPVAYLVLFLTGGVLFVAGLGINIVAWTSMTMKIKMYKELKEGLTLAPILDIYGDNIRLGMSFRF